MYSLKFQEIAPASYTVEEVIAGKYAVSTPSEIAAKVVLLPEYERQTSPTVPGLQEDAFHLIRCTSLLTGNASRNSSTAILYPIKRIVRAGDIDFQRASLDQICQTPS